MGGWWTFKLDELIDEGRDGWVAKGVFADSDVYKSRRYI